MKIISSGGGSAGTARAAGGGFSSIGVEVGHASNLAMRVMEQKLSTGGTPAPGSPEYYREFVQETETIYKLMKGLKAKLDSAEYTVPTVKPESKPVLVPEKASEPEDLSDLF